MLSSEDGAYDPRMGRIENASTQANAELVARLWHEARHKLARRRRPLLWGISGLQGCGKSTLAAALVAMARANGVPAIALSLDDFYLGRRERLALARSTHPLLRTRGVPGTHDLDLLNATLVALACASSRRPARVPRFDKARDTRRPPSRWTRVVEAPRLIVLEGWCIGLRPQAPAALLLPVNALERAEDADGRWRRTANRALRDYRSLWQRLDRLVLLKAPGWEIVRTWRGEAENKLRQARRSMAHTLDAAALDRFLQHYERLSRHALRTLPRWADLTIALDAQRRPRDIAG